MGASSHRKNKENNITQIIQKNMNYVYNKSAKTDVGKWNNIPKNKEKMVQNTSLILRTHIK